MPAELEACVSKVAAQLRSQRPNWSEKRITDAAFGICTESLKKKKNQKEESTLSPSNTKIDLNKITEDSYIENIPFNFFVKTEFIREKKANIEKLLSKIPDLNLERELAIYGTASSEGTTKNGNTYEATELRKAAPGLKGKPIVRDHWVNTENTEGKVKIAWFEESIKATQFVGGISKNSPIAEKVDLGYIDGVSVGGFVKEAVCSICDEKMKWNHKHEVGEEYDGETTKRLMRGIMYEELTLTPVPADEGANFSVANSLFESVDQSIMTITESFQRNKSFQDHESNTVKIQENVQKLPDQPDNSELRAALTELQQKTEEMKTMETKNAELSEKFAEMKANQHNSLVETVVSLEIKAEQCQESAKRLRTLDLSEKDDKYLSERAKILQEYIDNRAKEPQKGGGTKSKTFSEDNPNSGNIANAPQFKEEDLVKEAKMRAIGRLIFGETPRISKKGAATLAMFNENTKKWRHDVIA